MVMEMLLVAFMNEIPNAEVQEAIATRSPTACYQRAYKINNDDRPMSGLCVEKSLWERLQDLNAVASTAKPIFVGGQLVGMKPMTF